MKRPRFKIGRSRLTGLWYLFDRLTGTVVTAPTHEEAVHRCDLLADAVPDTVAEPTA